MSTGQVAVGASDQDLAVGMNVGEYKIEVAIGRGGFGTVYRAVHPLIGKQVAIKVLARKYSSDPEVVSRFVAEARAVNQIRHRNIIDIFAFGALPDGRHYYVMEHLDGEPFDQYLRRIGPLPLADALPILRAIARALDAAHAKGIAHRDLKPENIFLAHDADGATFPKLLDFGIAKLLQPEEDVRHRTGTGVPIGTPYYMSPEQCRGRDVDHRTDVYSFGIVAYRVLAGALPFEGEDYVDLLFKQVNEEPVRPSSRNPALPPSVDAAIAWMMAKDRDRRPATVLEGVLALDPSEAHATPSIPPRPRSKPSITPPLATAATMLPDALAATTMSPPPRRRSLAWVGGGLVVVGGAVAVILALQRSPEPDIAPPPVSPVVAAAIVVDAAPPPPPATPIDAPAIAQPATVALTFSRLPLHSRVAIGGRLVEISGRLEVEKSSRPISLRLSADGYISGIVQVTPDRDQTLDVSLHRALITTPRTTPDDPHGIPDSNEIFHRGTP